MGRRLGIPVVHLDTLYWGPSWKKPDLLEFRQRVRSALESESWICEGNYTKQTFDLKLPRADLIIWLDTPRTVCCFRVVKRAVFDRRRSDLPASCIERIDLQFLSFVWSVWTFDSQVRPGMEADSLLQRHAAKIVRLETKRDIARFLASLGTT